MSEEIKTVPDDATTSREKNDVLNHLINGSWNRLEIIKIERVDNGWRVTYKKEN